MAPASKTLLRAGQAPATVNFRDLVRRTERNGKKQLVRLFNINYRTLEKIWRPAIWHELRQHIQRLSTATAPFRFFQLVQSTPDYQIWIDIAVRNVMVAIPELQPDSFVNATRFDQNVAMRDATDQTRIHIPESLMLLIVTRLVKKEILEMNKHPLLQDPLTAASVMTKGRKRKRGRKIVSPRKAVNFGTKKFKHSLLYVVAFENRAAYKAAPKKTEWVVGQVSMKFEDLIRDGAHHKREPDFNEKKFELAKLWAFIDSRFSKDAGNLYHVKKDCSRVEVTDNASFQEALLQRQIEQRRADLPFVFWYKPTDQEWPDSEIEQEASDSGGDSGDDESSNYATGSTPSSEDEADEEEEMVPGRESDEEPAASARRMTLEPSSAARRVDTAATSMPVTPAPRRVDEHSASPTPAGSQARRTGGNQRGRGQKNGVAIRHSERTRGTSKQ